MMAGPRVSGEVAETKETLYSVTALAESGDWELVREARFAKGYTWGRDGDHMVNTAPEGTPYKDVRSMKDGMALSIYALPEPLPEAFDVQAVLQTDKAAAAGLVLNAQLDGDELRNHYLVLLYHDGVNVWKYTYTGEGKFQGAYLRLGWRSAKLEADRDYHLKVRMSVSKREGFGKGNVLEITLDGDHWFSVTDASPFPPGRMGIWLGEGFARVKEVRIK